MLECLKGQFHPCFVGFFKWYKLFQSEMDKVGLLFVTFLQENERIMV